MIPVLVAHEQGCKYARPEVGGHTDPAKRLSDWYNLHMAAGAPIGYFIAVSLDNGDSDGCAYPDRAVAMKHQHGHEKWYAYVQLGPASMNVCAAESVMRWQRQTYKLQEKHIDQEEFQGGRQIIPRLCTEDLESQMAAIRSGRGVVAMGYSRKARD